MIELLKLISMLCAINGGSSSGDQIIYYQQKCQKELLLCIKQNENRNTPESYDIAECLRNKK